MIQTNNIYQLIGFFIGALAFMGTTLKMVRWYLDTQKEITLAKTRENLLTAAEVAKLVSQTQEVKKDLIELREASKEQNEEIIKAIDKIEDNMKSWDNMLKEILIARVQRFDQSFLK